MRDSTLIRRAIKAKQKAYCPYSNYKVGAALVTKTGKVFTGCNIENAAYGDTICAERVALVKAVSEGYTEFEAIAVATKDGGTPCGSCRQVLNEFTPDVRVLTVDRDGYYRHSYLSDLLTSAFGPKNLNKKGI